MREGIEKSICKVEAALNCHTGSYCKSKKISLHQMLGKKKVGQEETTC